MLCSVFVNWSDANALLCFATLRFNAVIDSANARTGASMGLCCGLIAHAFSTMLFATIYNDADVVAVSTSAMLSFDGY
jgi:hypothetical protein